MTNAETATRTTPVDERNKTAKSDSKLTTARQFQRAGPAASVSWRDYRDERCASTYSQKLLSIAFVLLRR